MDPNHEWAMWTFEYTICYLLGPLIGGFVGGTVFNFVSETMLDMEEYGEDEDEDLQASLKRKATNETENDV